MNADNLAESPAPLVPEFPIVAVDGSQVRPTEPAQRAVDVSSPKGKKTTRNQKRRIVEMDRRGCVRRAGGGRFAHVRRPGVSNVPSGSMLPTLQIGDRIVVIKFGYTIQRGDIVVFKRPPQDVGTQDKDLVKRVIGLAGRDDLVSRNTVLINGRPLAEPFLPPLTGLCAESAENIPLTKIAPGHYFVMGDCRGKLGRQPSLGDAAGLTRGREGVRDRLAFRAPLFSLVLAGQPLRRALGPVRTSNLRWP